MERPIFLWISSLVTMFLKGHYGLCPMHRSYTIYHALIGIEKEASWGYQGLYPNIEYNLAFFWMKTD